MKKILWSLLFSYFGQLTWQVENKLCLLNDWKQTQRWLCFFFCGKFYLKWKYCLVKIIKFLRILKKYRSFIFFQWANNIGEICIFDLYHRIIAWLTFSRRNIPLYFLMCLISCLYFIVSFLFASQIFQRLRDFHLKFREINQPKTEVI